MMAKILHSVFCLGFFYFLCFRDGEQAWCLMNPSTKAWTLERLLRHTENTGCLAPLMSYRQAVSTKVRLIIQTVCLRRDAEQSGSAVLPWQRRMTCCFAGLMSASTYRQWALFNSHVRQRRGKSPTVFTLRRHVFSHNSSKAKRAEPQKVPQRAWARKRSQKNVISCTKL